MRKFITSTLMVCILFAASSQTIRINKSFGAKGIASVYGGPANQNVISEIIQKIFPLENGLILQVTSNDFYTQIIRRLDNGKIDKSYGTDGISESVKMFSYQSAPPVMQPDGKLIVAGSVNFGNANIVLARFTKNGKLDPSFGNAGMVVTNFGLSDDRVIAIGIDHANRIIIGGQTQVNGQNNIVLSRFTSAGLPDLSFNGTGTATYFQSYISALKSIVILADNKILGIGLTYVSGGYGLKFELFDTTGIRDFSFNSNNLANADMLPVAVAVQPDGKIVIGGLSGLRQGSVDSKFGLLRINPDATSDFTFNNGNMVSTDFGSTINYLTDLAIAANGKIVAAGWSQYTEDQDFTVSRYNADGSADISLNSTGTKVIHLSDSQDIINAVAFQNNKVIVAGFSYVGNGYDFATVRLRQNGDLDNSFGKAGKLIDNLPGSQNAGALDLQRQSDGKLLAAIGYSENFPVGTATVTFKTKIERFKADGSVDNAFGKAGLIDLDANSVFTLFNDRVLAASYSSGDIKLNMFKANGNPDPSFGVIGSLIKDFGADETPAVVKQQSSNKFLLGGYTSSATGSDILIVRLMANGESDLSFGVQGKIIADVGGNNDYVTNIAIQNDGKILIAGNYIDASYHSNIFVARYTADGLPDPGFGENGKFIYTQTTYNYITSLTQTPSGRILLTAISYLDYPLPPIRYVMGLTAGGLSDNSFSNGGLLTTDAASLVLQDDGKIITGGAFLTSNSSDVLLSRFLPDGAVDNSFGINGSFVQKITSSDDGLVKIVLKNNDLYAIGNTVSASNTVFLNSYNLGAGNTRVMEDSASVFDIPAGLLKILPNPSAGEFVLQTFNAYNTAAVTLKVYNNLGQQVEEKQFAAGSTHFFGEKYKPGIYFAAIRQGVKTTVIRLVKL